MADGRLTFDTKLDTSGFEKELEGLAKKVNNIDVDTSGIEKELNGLGKEAEGVKDDVNGLKEELEGLAKVEKTTKNTAGDTIKGILGADLIKQAASAVLDFGKDAIMAASELQEVDNVVQVTFGDNAPLIDSFAKKATKSFGMTETAAKKYAGTFGSILKAMGMTDEQTVQYAQNLTGLAADLASFYNLDFETAYEKLRSGIVGETEPLMDLGIDLRVTALEEYAESLGLVYSELDITQQAELRYMAIMDKTSGVQGYFSRTGTSFSNQLKIFQTNIENLKTALGETLLPVAEAALTAINGLFNPTGPTPVINQELQDATRDLNDLAEAARTSREEFKSTESAIQGRAELAQGYLKTLEVMKSTGINTDEDVLAVQNAITGLTTLYDGLDGILPDLEEVYIGSTALANTNTDAILANIEAYKELALLQLYGDRIQEQLAELAAAQDAVYTATEEVEDSKKKASEKSFELNLAEQLRKQLFEENDFTEIGAVFDKIASQIPQLDMYYNRDESGRRTLKEGVTPSDIDLAAVLAGWEAAAVKIEAEKQALEQQVADAETALLEVQKIVNDAEAQIESTIARKNEVAKTIEGIGAEFGAELEESSPELADAMDTAMEGMKESADENAQEMAKDVKKAINDELENMKITVDVTAQVNYKYTSKERRLDPTSNSSISGHATGLDYVPYDDYVARLHVGEAVLTAAEARRWRSEGVGGGADAANAVAMAVETAVRSERSRPIVLTVGGRKLAEATAADNRTALGNRSKDISRGKGHW